MCGDKEQSTKPKEEPSIPASLGPTAALQKQELRKRWTPQSHPMQSPKKRKHPYIPRAEPHIQKALGGIRFDAQVCRKLLSNPARSDHIYIYIYIYIYHEKHTSDYQASTALSKQLAPGDPHFDHHSGFGKGQGD